MRRVRGAGWAREHSCSSTRCIASTGRNRIRFCRAWKTAPWCWSWQPRKIRRSSSTPRCWRAARKDEIFSAEQLQEILQRRAPIYDKSADGHYNLISALHKSVRGSDPDAALYYLARMMDAGEDPLFLARRVVRMAVEDIGLADPQALVICN